MNDREFIARCVAENERPTPEVYWLWKDGALERLLALAGKHSPHCTIDDLCRLATLRLDLADREKDIERPRAALQDIVGKANFAGPVSIYAEGYVDGLKQAAIVARAALGSAKEPK